MDKNQIMEYKGKIPTGIYKHFKGNRYEVLHIASNSETLEAMVVYRALYGEGGIWVRPAVVWCENVEHNGKLCARFSLVEDMRNPSR